MTARFGPTGPAFAEWLPGCSVWRDFPRAAPWWSGPRRPAAISARRCRTMAPGTVCLANVAAMPDDLPDLRASHADRDRVVDALRVAGGDGRLSAEELDTR